ncbi:MAG: Ribonuclease [Phycisphaerae bacterium]|nr:Ribonuclease [Phycisphaerae bacterium]
MAELLFHGAAGEVTGSMHMLNVQNHWIALDCGLFQGRRAESETKNRSWPMAPSKIEAVVLSHAHIDHTGRLPKLVHDGFDGPIFCTPATRDLCSLMLMDSAHIQQEDIKYVNKKRAKNHLPPVEALYTEEDARQVIRLMQGISYDRTFSVLQGIHARFVEAGHMLGSAGIFLEWEQEGHADTLYFTGDVGRPNKPILRDPAPFPLARTVICESTYGHQITESVDHAQEELVSTVKRTWNRGGKVITPAFSVGRTQTLVYFLQEAMSRGDLPGMPIFVDGPLATQASEIFRMHPDCYDAQALDLIKHTGGLFNTSGGTFIEHVEESKTLNDRRDPCIIIAASGMCEAGRIRHHIKNNIENPKNTLLLAGYQAVNTLGRKLADGAKTISLFNETFQVNAEIIQLHGFSGHADQADLLKYLAPCASHTETLFLVHGELMPANTLAGKAREVGFWQVKIAERDLRAAI